ncbi:MAG: alpha/beta fold hydrolase, partial [Nitrososphaerales archaeon]
DGSVRLGWLDAYERSLARGDKRGAFTRMVKGAGFAPRVLTVMPYWYVRLVLRVAFRGPSWRATEPLLEPTLGEHKIVAALASENVERFSEVNARVGLLAGTRSPKFVTKTPLAELARVIPNAEIEWLESLGHLGPEEAPDAVAVVVMRHL